MTYAAEFCSFLPTAIKRQLRDPLCQRCDINVIELTVDCIPLNTGVENLGIIFEFSPWVLKICPEDGLKVRPLRTLFTNMKY